MLRLALSTVLSQDLAHADFEVLVIGDGCTDDSEAVVRGFNDPRLHWYNLPVNSGSQSAPNNAGLGMSRGRYIAHIGHDDFWFPWHLSGLVGTIEQTGADWAYPLVLSCGPEGIVHCDGPPQADVPDAEHFVPPSGWLYRREIIPDVGWWADPATIPWAIDFDYMRRAALAGKQFAFYKRPTVLKFPAARFDGAYEKREPAPIQRHFFDRLQQDPERFERDALLDVATEFARVHQGHGKGVFRRQRDRGSGRAIWPTFRRWIITYYGAERWPVRQLLIADWQKVRLRRRRKKGLVSTSPPQELEQTHQGMGRGLSTDQRSREERRARRQLREERRRLGRTASRPIEASDPASME
jgi:glycosyltransferase involved in cell wall biosynthesis